MSGINDVQPPSLADRHADLCAQSAVPFVLEHDAETRIDTARYGPVALPFTTRQALFFDVLLAHAIERQTPHMIMETGDTVEVVMFFRAVPPAPEPTT